MYVRRLTRWSLPFVHLLTAFLVSLSNVALGQVASQAVPATTSAASAPADQLILHPVTDGMPRSRDFTIKVRKPGGEWKDLPAYYVKVARDAGYTRTPQEASIASFDFAGKVDVSITSVREPVKSVRVRPLSCGVVPQVEGNTITFSLTEPHHLSVEVNGDIFHNLHLLTNAPETDRPNPADPNVIYYGPGVHQVNTMRVVSSKTIYVAGGALIQGNLRAVNVENVRIMGRGILLSSGNSRGFLIERSKNIEVEGLIVVPSGYTILVGNSEKVTIKNIKSFSAGTWNDGIDIFCSTDITVDGIFMRNSDDCIAIYGHRWNYVGDVRNIVVKNSTLWADVAHPIMVGTHGNTQTPETLENLQFTNIDILDQKESQLDYQGCMAINAGDSNLIRKVRFENIRVEDFREGQLLNLRVMYNSKYNTSPGRSIEDVLFKDVTYNGTNANLSVIAGYDDTRGIRKVIFENLTINGRVIADNMPGKPGWYKTGDMAHILIGEHAEEIVFRAGHAVETP